jgi:hypothetical protein
MFKLSSELLEDFLFFSYPFKRMYTVVFGSIELAPIELLLSFVS